MSMTRDDAIAYLADALGPLLTEAGITPDSAGLGSVLDRALLLTGTAYADLATATVDDNAIVGFLAVLDWQALAKVWTAVANRVTVSKSLGTPSVSKSESRNQIVDNVKKLLDVAEAAAAPYVTVGTDGAFSTGVVRLGAMEECSWAF